MKNSICSGSLKIYGMYFSGTGTTERIVTEVTDAMALKVREISGLQSFGAEHIDFTPPAARERIYKFKEKDIVVFGVPVIAGRVPNVLLPFLETLEGGGALAVPVVLYGNRNFDDALIELRNILEDRGFHTIAAGAFIGEHSFSKKLAAGRPDEEDVKVARDFGEGIITKIMEQPADEIGRLSAVEVDGQDPIRPYYKPRDRQGNHINILKVKPKVDREKCSGCGICADVCPMGSISKEDPGVVNGICIKCCGCEKKCPEGAIYFDDPGYLYHKEELEIEYADRKEPKLFF